MRAASSAMGFNVDSGATDTIVRNKDQVQLYSMVNHPIEVANGSFIHATAVGKLSGPAGTLDQVLVCPEISQNLLSVSKLEDQGFDTLFSKGNVYIGTGMSTGITTFTGSRHG